jgi:hypothetical protein
MAQGAGPTRLTYNVEWRLIDAGRVTVGWNPKTPTSGEATLAVETLGMVARLFKVNNDYRVVTGDGYCAQTAVQNIREGARHRTTEVRYDSEGRRAYFVEHDLLKNRAVVAQRETEIPPCVHDVVAGMVAMRANPPKIGSPSALPVSDGRKFAMVRVEAQVKEAVTTPLGKFDATRYEVFLMNDVIYGRKGRVFVWLSNDERRLPVQIRVRLQLLVGTITLQLAKEDRQ